MELRYFLAPAVGTETVSMGLDLVMGVVYNHPLPHADRFLYNSQTGGRKIPLSLTRLCHLSHLPGAM